MAKKDSSIKKFVWHRDKCKQCDVCQKICPQGGLKFVDGILTRDEVKCNLCGLCSLYCPDQAIEIVNTKKQTGKKK